MADGCGEPFYQRIPIEYSAYTAAEEALKTKIKDTTKPTIEKEIIFPHIYGE